MRLYIAIQSRNDIITNSSTEILSIKTTYTPEILKEIIMNCALLNDSGERPDPDDDIQITKVDVADIANDLYGDVTSEELKILEIILCKRLDIDYTKWEGELYTIEIEHHLSETINFLRSKFGAS
jgi:hypothetical protein